MKRASACLRMVYLICCPLPWLFSAHCHEGDFGLLSWRWFWFVAMKLIFVVHSQRFLSIKTLQDETNTFLFRPFSAARCTAFFKAIWCVGAVPTHCPNTSAKASNLHRQRLSTSHSSLWHLCLSHSDIAFLDEIRWKHQKPSALILIASNWKRWELATFRLGAYWKRWACRRFAGGYCWAGAQTKNMHLPHSAQESAEFSRRQCKTTKQSQHLDPPLRRGPIPRHIEAISRTNFHPPSLCRPSLCRWTPRFLKLSSSGGLATRSSTWQCSRFFGLLQGLSRGLSLEPKFV